MPLNLQALNVVITRADLLDAAAMPRELRQFVAHVSAFKVVINKWTHGDYSLTRCGVRYPDVLQDWVNKEFLRLKRTQYTLLMSHKYGVTGLGEVFRGREVTGNAMVDQAVDMKAPAADMAPQMEHGPLDRVVFPQSKL